MDSVTLPLPPIQSDTDVRDLDGFMLNVERLMASELVALSSHEVIAAALFLWCRAWKQLPAASLPDDDRVIAAFARLPLPKFRKLRAEVMRGFVKCSDGRWYHGVLAMEAASAYSRKQTFQKKRDGDAERLRKWRESKRETRDETVNETQSETRFVAEGQGQGQGQGQGLSKQALPLLLGEPVEADTSPKPPDKPAATTRGTRLSKDWQLPRAWGLWAIEQRPTWTPDHVRAIADKFRDHWTAKAGRDATKVDWEATWRNWVRNETGGTVPQQTRANSRTETLAGLTGGIVTALPAAPERTIEHGPVADIAARAG